MKLLGWMHRKSRQKSSKPFNEFTTGNTCALLSMQPSLYEQHYYLNPTFNSAYKRQPQEGCQRTCTELKTKRVEEYYEEESSVINSAPFDGFLTIGTLWLEENITEPPTPTFPTPIAQITKKETEVTENELKLINDELEKFLEAEAKEVGDELSGRNSYVSNITISEKQIEDVDPNESGDAVACPLQGYLFGSTIELPETNLENKKERTSLGQLFKRDSNNTVDDYLINKCEEEEKQTKGIYGVRSIRKVLKKLHYSSNNSAASAVAGASADLASTKRKLPQHKDRQNHQNCFMNQVLGMFHRKIHPERSTVKVEFAKSHKCGTKKSSKDGDYKKRDTSIQDKNSSKAPLGAMLKKDSTNLNLTSERLCSAALTQKREHWIKTDADYLVLEL